MKLFLFLLVLVGAYTFSLLKTTDMVLGQAMHLNTTYQYVANNADKIAGGQNIPSAIVYQP
jgi:hypothetical protein